MSKVNTSSQSAANLISALDVVEGKFQRSRMIQYLLDSFFIDILLMIIAKFLLSLPLLELNKPERLFFHIELAFWFYEVIKTQLSHFISLVYLTVIVL